MKKNGEFANLTGFRDNSTSGLAVSNRYL